MCRFKWIASESARVGAQAAARASALAAETLAGLRGPALVP